MRLDPNSEARLAKVFPGLADKIRELAGAMANIGIEIRVTQGLRTNEEQDGLYAQGRTKPGPIVTNCRGGHSYHNFGLAVDCVPDDVNIPGFQCDWNLMHPVWQQMVKFAELLGLNCGADWRTFKDWPHFQLTGRFPVGSPNEEIRNLYASGGLAAVWREVDAAAAPQKG